VQQCQTLIHESVQRTMKQVQHRDLGVMVKQLRHRLHTISENEQTNTLKLLRQAQANGDEQQMLEALETHNRRLINKILHLPLSTLEQTDGAGPMGFYAAALKRLFDLPGGPASDTPEHPEALGSGDSTEMPKTRNPSEPRNDPEPHPSKA